MHEIAMVRALLKETKYDVKGSVEDTILPHDIIEWAASTSIPFPLNFPICILNVEKSAFDGLGITDVSLSLSLSLSLSHTHAMSLMWSRQRFLANVAWAISPSLWKIVRAAAGTHLRVHAIDFAGLIVSHDCMP